MAKRGKTPPEPAPAALSVEDMNAGIKKLERRIKELKRIDLDNFDPDDPEINKLEDRIQMAIVDVFGNGTIEYNQFHIRGLYGLSEMVITSYEGPAESHARKVRAYREGIPDAIAKLEGARDYLAEKLDDLGEAPGAQAVRAFEGFEMHPAISSASSTLFRDRHYSEAIVAACKALNNIVQNASGVFDKDGDTLMRHVFSAKNPVLSFNDMADQWDEGEQRGFMELFTGAIAAFRNPRAHKFIEDDPDFALEVIAFVSFLAKLVDKAERREP